jgi:hypothetical protein
MEVNEPVAAYGLSNNHLEEMKSQIIAVIKDMTDVTTVTQFYNLLKSKKNIADKKEKIDLEGVSDKVKSWVGIAANISPEDIANDDRLAYLLSK